MVSRETKFKIFAFVLICFSICMNFKVWIYDGYIVPYFKLWKIEREIIIKPTLISTFISLLILGGYVIRNIADIFNDCIKIAFIITDILFFSGFIAMFANSETIIFGISSQGLLLMIIVLMWIGLKSLLRYIILAFISASIFFISQLNKAMGFFGALYILCAFLSFSIQIYTNILPNVTNIKNEFFGNSKEKKTDENYELEDNY